MIVGAGKSEVRRAGSKDDRIADADVATRVRTLSSPWRSVFALKVFS